MGNCACGGEVVLRCEKCGADWLDDLCCQNNALRARVAELEAKLAMAIAVGDETADLRKAAEQRVSELEGIISDLTARAFTFGDKPHQLFSCVRAMAERYACDSLRNGAVQKMDEAYENARTLSSAVAAEQRVKRLEEALCEAERWIVEHDGEAEDCECSYCSMLTRIRAALAASEAPASSAASDNKCECGADDYCVSATLIACRSCGRTWGRCNGKWVLDTETVPGGKS